MTSATIKRERWVSDTPPMDHDEGQRRELFIFPDGTPVEMIVFDRATAPRKAATRRAGGSDSSCPAPLCSPPPPRAAAGATEASAPTACLVCGSGLIYPVDWERNREGSWNIEIRCPNCELRRTIVLAREGVETLNRAIYLGTQELAHEADVTARSNFSEESRKLVDALLRDLILPMDF